MATVYHKKFLESLVEIHGMLYHLNTITSQYTKLYKKNSKMFRNGFVLGSKLIYRHPVTMLQTWGPTNYQVHIRNLEGSVAKIHKYISNYFASQVYEAFETYLYNITAKAAVRYPGNIKKVQVLLKSNTVKDYRTQLKTKYTNSFDLYTGVTVKLLLNLQHAIKDKSKNYKFYTSFLKAYGVARNCITHSQGLVKTETYHKLQRDEQRILQDFYGIKVQGNKFYSIDTSKDIRLIIETTAELGALIDHYLDSPSLQ